jgi:hypothetical protein
MSEKLNMNTTEILTNELFEKWQTMAAMGLVVSIVIAICGIYVIQRVLSI